MGASCILHFPRSFVATLRKVFDWVWGLEGLGGKARDHIFCTFPPLSHPPEKVDISPNNPLREGEGEGVVCVRECVTASVRSIASHHLSLSLSSTPCYGQVWELRRSNLFPSFLPPSLPSAPLFSPLLPSSQ